MTTCELRLSLKGEIYHRRLLPLHPVNKTDAMKYRLNCLVFCIARSQGSDVSSEGPALPQMLQAVGRDHAEDVKLQVTALCSNQAVG